MKRSRLMTPAVLFCLLPLAFAQSPQPKPSEATIARGRYLVEDVGMCGDCHSPMDQRGQPIKGKHLDGATLPFRPLFSMPAWAALSTPIAGLPGWEADDAVQFLMTGKSKTGKVARPPMPQYRFSREDAIAIVSYLKAMKSQSKE